MIEADQLSQSPDFISDVDDVKKMPSLSEQQLREKKERIVELRMNFYLDNAKLCSGAVGALTEDPTMDEDELAKYLQDFFVITRPELVKNFINQLITTKNKVLEVVKAMKGSYESQKDSVAAHVYRQLAGYVLLIPEEELTNLPVSEVKFGRKYPLAVSLDVPGDADFAVLDPRSNVGGFFNQEASFVSSENFDKTERHHFFFPLIVNHGLSRKRVEDHERGHAANKVLQQSLRQCLDGSYGSHSRVAKLIWGWGSQSPPTISIIDTKSRFNQEMGKKEIQELKETKEWRRIISWALSRAKDELVAEMNPVKGNIDWHTKNLAKRRGLYDYFDKQGIEKTNPLHRLMWKDYSNKLWQSTINLRKLFNFYSKSDLWQKRQEVLQWVVAQIPMEELDKRLKNSGFIEEMDLYNELKLEPFNLLSQCDFIFPPQRELTEVEIELKERLDELHDQFSYYIKSNSDRSLLGYLQSLKKELSEIKSRLEETAVYQDSQREAFFLKRFNSLKKEVVDFGEGMSEDEKAEILERLSFIHLDFYHDVAEAQYLRTTLKSILKKYHKSLSKIEKRVRKIAD